MKKVIRVIGVGLLGLNVLWFGPGCGKSGDSGTVTVKDGVEAKPIMTYDGKLGFDVEEVAVSSDGSHMTFRVTFAKPVEEVMQVHRIGLSPISIELDTDHKPTTGGLAWENPTVGGFESEIRIYAAAKYPNGGMGWQGGSSDYELVGVVPTYFLGHYNEGEKAQEMHRRTDTFKPAKPGEKPMLEHNSGSCSLESTVITIAVPYADLKVKPGQTIRLVFHEEYAMGTAEDIFFGETTYTLK